MPVAILEQFRPLVGLFVEAISEDFRLAESIAQRASASQGRPEIAAAA